jgi:hypothetical protein
VINSMRQVGGALGIAVMGTVVATQVSVVPGAPGYAPQFVDGYHRALLVGAALLLSGAVVAVLTIGRTRRPEPRAVEEPVVGLAPTFEEAA